MVCGVCKKTAVNYKKIKRGNICEQCYRNLPVSVQASADQFTAAQLKSLSGIIHMPTESDNRSVWAYSGNRHLKFTRNAVWLGHVLIYVKDLRSIRLDFHAKGLAKDPNTVTGTITVVLETKSPHFLLEEPLSKNDICLNYRINGCEITYEFPYHLDHLIQYIQMALVAGATTLDGAKRKMEEKRQEEERRRAEEEKNRQEERARTQNHTGSNPKSPFDAAKKLFGVELPFTKQELKRIRNRLIIERNAHPDIGGSDEAFKEIQGAYELLLKYAS